VAGEPGGSIPATRKRIEKAWGARVFDHTGMTEIGSLGFECVEAPGGVHLIESECIAEVVDPGTDETLPPGRTGELVLTNLGRLGSPLLRYRTGDLVRLSVDRCACGRHFARMVGGILGRTDEMIIVRGNNVYPSAIEAIVRQFGDIAEFRIEAIESGSLNNVRIEIEPFPAAGARAGQLTRQVAKTVQERLMFGPEVVVVAPGSLPRFELKASRFVRGTARKAETQ
jgi:phenylacetate-CoA ligase